MRSALILLLLALSALAACGHGTDDVIDRDKNAPGTSWRYEVGGGGR